MTLTLFITAMRIARQLSNSHRVTHCINQILLFLTWFLLNYCFSTISNSCKVGESTNPSEIMQVKLQAIAGAIRVAKENGYYGHKVLFFHTGFHYVFPY